MEKGKPGLAILIGHALAKKGKAENDPMAQDGEEKSGEYDAHLQSICDDLMDAIHAKDSGALKDLLQEAFECMDAAPHMEGPHEEE
jgi:hypothetical protein